MILRARAVVPVSQPPIENGALLVRRGRIAAVGKWGEPPFCGTAMDLGESLIMPGLVNAHCHLDYTNMAGQFPPPKVFTDWLKLITSTKAGWGYSDYAESWLTGAEMLLRTGTTTVADIEAIPQLLPQVWAATPLRVISFFELIGIGRRPAREVMGEVMKRVKSLRSAHGRVGLSPHAPYSTVPDLLRLCARTASARNWRVVTHIAESALEYEMFLRGRGEMYKWLQRSSRDMSDCGSCSPVEHLERCGVLGSNLIAVHANYLKKTDPALLAAHEVSIVHCPRSHVYFGHRPFPLRRLVKEGVNVCLGTDSLASVRKSPRQGVELSMFDEMRSLAYTSPRLSPKSIVPMATVNGARALGLAGKIGELSPGAFADLVVIPSSASIARIYDSIIGYSGAVQASMINGTWVYPANKLN